MSKQVYADRHTIKRCDASTGHAVRNIAFCEDRALAQDIAVAIDCHDALLDAVKDAAAYFEAEPDLLGRNAILARLNAAIAKATGAA